MKRTLSLTFCLVIPAIVAARSWSPANYPNPLRDVYSCGRQGVSSWVCDPDGLISYESANVVEGVLKQIFAGNSPYALGPCGAGYKGYQVAVALMRRMQYSGDASVAAQDFAKVLHNRWGVGDASCNNGVLFFLSVEDRQLYISTGTGTTSRLTYDVLGNIIDDVRPALKESRYNDAVERGVVDIGLALAGRAIEPDPRGGGGGAKKDDLLAFLIFGSVAGGMMFYAARSASRRQRRYQDCKSKLEKLKRDQAAMRASTYNPTSCPVCLEDFTDVSSSNGGSGNGSGSNSSGEAGGAGGGSTASSSEGPGAKRTGSGPAGKAGNGGAEDEEAELRRPLVSPTGAAAGCGGGGCGGVEMTDAAGGGGVTGAAGGSPSAGPGAAAANGGAPPPGSRRPLVLPCGHAFCEPCITKWLDQKKVTCPICRKPFDEEDSPDTSNPRGSRPPTSNTTPRPGDPGTPGAGNGGAGPSSSSGYPPRPPCTVDDDPDDAYYYDRYGSTPGFASTPRWGGSGVGVGVGVGAPPRLRLRWGNRRRFGPGGGFGFGGMPYPMQEEMLLAEMMFRLRQLQRQHPDYISPGMLHNWEQDLQHGREFNSQQLREFQLRDPATRQALAHSGSSGARTSFGGGSGGGGGGRGSSW